MSQREWLKLALLIVGLAGTAGLVWAAPVFHMPLFLAGVTTLLLSPLVKALQRVGYPKLASILTVFAGLGLFTTWATVNLSQTLIEQWDALVRDTPRYLEQSTLRLAQIEREWMDRYPALRSLIPTAGRSSTSATSSAVDALSTFGRKTVYWGLNNIPTIVGEILTWIFLVPIFVFVLLHDGDRIQKRVFQLVPNPYFESTFMVLSQIIESTSDYLRAKAVEALTVGGLTAIGLWAVGAPYALILGAIAGVTNILPYIGPLLGAAPGIILAFADPAYEGFLWPSVLVYVAVNAIDTVVLFPVFVGKLVDLHPVVLIVVVMLGQQFYGIVGMLLSVPVASAIKICLREIMAIISDPR